MSNRITLEFAQPPNAHDLALLIALAAKFNAVAVVVPDTAASNSDKKEPEAKDVKPSLNLNFKKLPTEIEGFALSPIQLNLLLTLFEDQPSAEDLCKLLN